MGGRLPAKYKWQDTWLTAKEIAELETIPVNTIRSYFSRCKGNTDCVRKMMERRGKPRLAIVRYPYRDGRMLNAAEIIELEPHMTTWKIKNRYRFCQPGDWDTIFSRKRVQVNNYNGISGKDNNFAVEGLGPRKNVMEIKGPSDYEQQLWNG